MDNIKVAIKVRPLIRRERDENSFIQWMTQGRTILATDADLKKRADGRFEFGKLMHHEINTKACPRFIYLGVSPSKSGLCALVTSVDFFIDVLSFTLDTKKAHIYHQAQLKKSCSIVPYRFESSCYLGL